MTVFISSPGGHVVATSRLWQQLVCARQVDLDLDRQTKSDLSKCWALRALFATLINERLRINLFCRRLFIHERP